MTVPDFVLADVEIDPMLILAFPRVFFLDRRYEISPGGRSVGLAPTHLVRQPTCKHLPKDHRTAEHVHLVIVSWLGTPEFGCLPIDRPDQRSNHAPSRILHPSETEIADFTDSAVSDQDVGRLALCMTRSVSLRLEAQFTSIDLRLGGSPVGYGREDRSSLEQYPASS